MENETAMTLSPATQAVLDAFLANWADDPLAQDRLCLATALRAAADQVVPQTPTSIYLEDYDSGVWEANYGARTWLLAIAAELEGSL